MSFQPGDKVKIIKGDYKGAEGTISTVYADTVVVHPNENADARMFHPSHVKKIASFSNEQPKSQFQTDEYREATAERLRKRYKRKDVQALEHKRRRTPEQRYVKARYDASHRPSGAKEFSLTFEEYVSIINGNCEYCNASIKDEAGSGLDRIDNDKGYVLGNINPCCSSCNRRRSKSMSAEEFKKQSILNGYWKDA